MKFIKVAYMEPHDPPDPMGHLEIPEIKDYINQHMSEYRAVEIEKHFDECPRCMDNYVTILNNMIEENENNKNL